MEVAEKERKIRGGKLREGKRDEIVPGESSFGLLSHDDNDSIAIVTYTLQ